MFTGIIQQVGKLTGKETSGTAARLTIGCPPWKPPLENGESIAVNGACLTVARLTTHGFVCDVLEETIRCTNLGRKESGAPLNLERAVRFGDVMGGHLVSGHIDGVGKIAERRSAGRDWQLDISCDDSLLRQIVLKGSVSCDGVSLTVTRLEKTFFSVNLIPHTWQNTALHVLQAGDTVNLETDLIGKYVFRWMGGQRSEISGQTSEKKPAKPITENTLRQAGFGK